ncbi:MAG: hypothetical protein HYX55_02275 [Chloroflexi bacterium]|nr:hypothetical protein [Chloroflexota bacterium]
MTARTAAGPLAALAALAVVVAACGSGTATTAPATQAPATQAPATQAPGATSAGQPSFDTSSFHADKKLEDLFPKTIGTETVSILSVSGQEFMGIGSAPELEAMLTAVGKTPADMSVAYGGAAGVTIIGFKVAGVPGDKTFKALFDAYGQLNEAAITTVTISGKSVKKVVPNDDSGTSYVYAAQDVVFAVGGEAITDAQLNEVFSKLP